MEKIDARLNNLENRIQNNVLLKSSNQTISSPIEFIYPVYTEYFSTNAIDSKFYLNDDDFDDYANNSLTINSEQIIGRKFWLKKGLNADQLFVNRINSKIDLKNAMCTNYDAETQFISNANHRFNSVELLNGTTASQINDVQLIDLYQDRSSPIQLIRGMKTFLNFSAQEFAIDNLMNGLNFQKFLDDVVWLENFNLTKQRLIGDWQFTNNIQVNNLTVANRINNEIDFNHFVNRTAKKNTPIVLTKPIRFKNYINVDLDLFVSGLINGLNLAEDIILLNGDQDFTKKYTNTPTLMFESSPSFHNITIDLLNQRIKTNDFLRKSQNNGKILLKNKNFLNNLVVTGNVKAKPNTQINGIVLEDLYRKLDTFVSFSRPIVANEIIISGYAYANQLNQFNSLYVQQRLANLLLRNYPQTFHIPLLYDGSLQVSKLSFNSYRSKLQFPQDFISKLNNKNEQEIVITGEKFFKKVIVDNIVLGENGTINGGRIGQIYDSMVRLNQNDQIIKGFKTFNNLEIDGNVYIRNDKIRDYFLNGTIDINSAKKQFIENPIILEEIIIPYKNFASKGLILALNYLFINFSLYFRFNYKSKYKWN